jgi:hypothetical protein
VLKRFKPHKKIIVIGHSYGYSSKSSQRNKLAFLNNNLAKKDNRRFIASLIFNKGITRIWWRKDLVARNT